MILRQSLCRQCRRSIITSYGAQRRGYAIPPESNTSPAEQSPIVSSIKPSQISPRTTAGDQLGNVLQDTVGPPDAVSEAYHNFQRHKQATQHLGSTREPYYQPHTLLTNPPSPSDITLELLLASQAHLGHATSRWNPANARYIYGVRQGIHIISLDVTASHLRRACTIVRSVAERAGLILFVGTRKGQDRAVVKAAELAGGCHLFTRWIPGTITNGQQILSKCATKVVDENDNPVQGYDEQLGNERALRPDLVVCLDPIENYILLHECAMSGIPTIGVIDTNADPTWVTYPIPANDDSLRCIQVIAGALGRAGQEGQMRRLAQAAKGNVTYHRSHTLQPIESTSISQQSDKGNDEAQLNKTGDDAHSVMAEVKQMAHLMTSMDENAVLAFGNDSLSRVEDDAGADADAEDPRLALLIAKKRKEMGEDMSQEDGKVLADYEASKKDATASETT